jgi:predicted dehydrogenase
MPASDSIGLVGCGHWGRHILRDLVALGCDVTVVANSGESRRRAAEGGAARVVSSVEEMPGVGGIVVCTPTATHAQVAERVLNRFDGFVFVEKPLTADPASARRLLGRAQGRLFVMHQWRYHPGVEMLRDIAQSGDLGELVGVRSTRVQWGNRHEDVDGIWILAPHDLSILLEIVGYLPEPKAAVGSVTAEKEASLIGVLGTRPWAVIEVSNLAMERRREVSVLCRDGVATLSGSYADHVEVRRRGGGEKLPISTELPLLRELRAFLECVDGGLPPKSSAAEGVAIVEGVAGLRALAGLEDGDS